MSIIVQNAPATARVNRSPRHDFYIAHRPFQIVPFMIAPVLPGETMKNLLLNASGTALNIRSPHAGAWVEHYFFYVKHRDLAAREILTNMMLNPETDVSSLKAAAAKPDFFQYKGGMNWLELAYDRIVEEYFRDEEEGLGNFKLGNYHLAKFNYDSWMDSLIRETDFVIEDQKVDVDNDGVIMASEVDEAMRNWQFARINKLTDMSYEDFLRTYGVSIPKAEELHRPELIRYMRDWIKPQTRFNTASQATQQAFAWNTQERADKDRFFKEPGFIVGLTVLRPKLPPANQAGAAVGFMDDALAWLPAIMRDDPYTSLKLIYPADHPVLTGVTVPYLTDIRDLLVHGDYFRNVAPPQSASVPLPDLSRRYPASADVDNIFAAAAAAADRVATQEGVVQLTILGTQRDTTSST